MLVVMISKDCNSGNAKLLNSSMKVSIILMLVNLGAMMVKVALPSESTRDVFCIFKEPKVWRFKFNI